MPILSKLIDTQTWTDDTERVVRHAFAQLGFRPSSNDVDEAMQTFRYRLLNPRTYEEGDRMGSNRFKRENAKFSVLTYLAERMGGRPKEVGLCSLSDLDESQEPSEDPLYGRSMLRRFGESEDGLRTAPYEVQFTSSYAEASRYRKNEYALPSFRIISGEAAAINPSWRRGQRRGLPYDSVNCDYHDALELQKDAYADALRQALPGYMRWLGVDALKPLDRSVVHLINRDHLADADVKRRLRIPHSTYHDVMARLASRGFEDFPKRKAGRMISYNPVLDSTQRYMNQATRAQILALRAEDLLAEDPAFTDASFHTMALRRMMSPDSPESGDST